MPLTRAEVEHIAGLAHVGLKPEEVDHFAHELSSVVDHVARLEQVNTEGIEPTSFAVVIHNVTREDLVVPSWPTDAVLGNAPQRVDDLFEVQAVLD